MAAYDTEGSKGSTRVDFQVQGISKIVSRCLLFGKDAPRFQEGPNGIRHAHRNKEGGVMIIGKVLREFPMKATLSFISKHNYTFLVTRLDLENL